MTKKYVICTSFLTSCKPISERMKSVAGTSGSTANVSSKEVIATGISGIGVGAIAICMSGIGLEAIATGMSGIGVEAIATGMSGIGVGEVATGMS